MRAYSLRGALALVVASALALGSVGLTAVSASAASVAGTFGIAANDQSGGFPSPYFTDDDAVSTANIPGITYRVFFTSADNTPASGTGSYNLGDPATSMIVNISETRSLVIESVGDIPFRLSSFRMQDAQGTASTYTATAYRNGAPTGTSTTFTASPSGLSSIITLPASFSNLDEVRITSDGGYGVPNTMYQEGFNNFVVADSLQQADLSALTVSAGALSPTFASGTTAYSRSVPNTTTSTTVTPTATSPGAFVTVNDVNVASGAASGSIALNVGTNVITTVVTAQDGSTTKTYTTTITRAAPPSSNANLSNLTLSAGALSPSFAANTTSYTATVPFATTSLKVTPTQADVNSSIRVNSTNVVSGNASGSIALAVGANTITTVVTAADSTTTKTYTTMVTRQAASSNNQLSNLSLSSGTLSPAFASATTAYSASVGNSVTSLSVTPTVVDAAATVTVNGIDTTSGNASGAVALDVGSNVIAVTVTSQMGTSQTYTVTVTRAGSSNADLSALSLSSGTLSPAFTSGTTSYTASVGNATTSLTVTPTQSQGDASTRVNGVPVSTGTTSGAMALSVGTNTITIVVTAENGTTTKTYTVTVTRAASSNSNLSALAISATSLSPQFGATTTSYSANVGVGIGSTRVTPTVADSTASVTVNGIGVTSGSASGDVALDPGVNTISVVVTAQNGATKTYTITVTRALPSTNSALSALSLSSGTLSPAFAAATTAYSASVDNSTTALTVTPTVADATATVTVNGATATSGNASQSIALGVGSTEIEVLVTAQDGTTTRSYTVVVNRAPSSNNNLSALALSGATLSPTFASSTLTYASTVAFGVTSSRVTPTGADSTATITVNGIVVTSGSASGSIALAVGDNTIDVSVEAQNGDVKQYTVTVTRTAASANSSLSALALSEGTLSPTFAASTTSYVLDLPNSVDALSVTPTVAESNATVTVNGTTVASGDESAELDFPVGSTAVVVKVTAQNGTSTSYTVTVVRAGSAIADLSGLTISEGTLSPAFDEATTSYAVSVPNATTSLTVTPVVADGTATVTVNGTNVASGSASDAIDLAVGATTITTVVTAQDGATTRSYTLSVTRASGPTVELTHDLVVGDDAEGATVRFTGENLIPGSTWVVTLHSAPVVLANGTIGLDGLLDVTVTLPAGIDPGAHRVALVITPPAGEAITSTVWFSVLADGTVGAISLVGPVGPTALSVTGIDAQSTLAWIVAALLAMLVGLALIIWRRRTSVAE